MKIVLVGGGNAAVTIMEHLQYFEDHEIVGVADLRNDAPGIIRASELDIITSTDMEKLFTKADVDMVIELTGVEKVRELIQDKLRNNQTLVTSQGALLMCGLIEAQERQNIERAEAITTKFAVLTERLESIISKVGSSAGTIEKLLREGSMVSINATIQAARAGDAGKAFGIVVNRITDLVAQIKDALDSINLASDGTEETLAEFHSLEQQLLISFGAEPVAANRK